MMGFAIHRKVRTRIPFSVHHSRSGHSRSAGAAGRWPRRPSARSGRSSRVRWGRACCMHLQQRVRAGVSRELHHTAQDTSLHDPTSLCSTTMDAGQGMRRRLCSASLQPSLQPRQGLIYNISVCPRVIALWGFGRHSSLFVTKIGPTAYPGKWTVSRCPTPIPRHWRCAILLP